MLICGGHGPTKKAATHTSARHAIQDEAETIMTPDAITGIIIIHFSTYSMSLHQQSISSYARHM